MASAWVVDNGLGGQSARVVNAPPSAQVSSNQNSGRQVGGWYDGQQLQQDGSYSSTPMGSNNSSSNNSAPQDNTDWDAMYAPAFAALDNAATSANENFNLASNDINLAKTSQIRDVQSEEDKANAFFAEGNEKAVATKDKAMQDAVRYYNALKQQGKNRAGGGSSLGQAMTEIGSEQFLRNQGQIEGSYLDIYKDLSNKQADALSKFSSTRLKIDEWAATQISSMKQQLNQQLVDINTSKAMTQVQKNEKKQAVLNEALQFTRSLNAAKAQADIQLDTWKQQQLFNIQQNLVPTYNQTLNTQGYQPEQITSSPVAQTQGGVVTGLRWNPNTKNFDPDESLRTTF